MQVTVAVNQTDTGSPLSNVGSYSHGLTVSTAATSNPSFPLKATGGLRLRPGGGRSRLAEGVSRAPGLTVPEPMRDKSVDSADVLDALIRRSE